MECFPVVPAATFDSFPVCVPVNCVHGGVRPTVSSSVVFSDSGGSGSVSYFTVVFGGNLVCADIQIDFVPRWSVTTSLRVRVCFIG